MARRFLARAIVAAALAACTSPTLPLPPPALPSITAGTSANSYHLRSEQGAIPNALILTVNRDMSFTSEQRVTGTLADANGTWEMDVLAKPGDALDLTQDNGTERSPDTTVEIPQ